MGERNIREFRRDTQSQCAREMTCLIAYQQLTKYEQSQAQCTPNRNYRKRRPEREYMCPVLTLVAQNVHTQHTLRREWDELKLEIISAGTTPTHIQTHTQTHVYEYKPFIFMYMYIYKLSTLSDDSNPHLEVTQLTAIVLSYPQGVRNKKQETRNTKHVVVYTSTRIPIRAHYRQNCSCQ